MTEDTTKPKDEIPKRKISSTHARICKMGPKKMVTIPRSVTEMQPGDEVLIIKVNHAMIEYLQELVAKDFMEHRVKLEYTDFQRNRRFY